MNVVVVVVAVDVVVERERITNSGLCFAVWASEVHMLRYVWVSKFVDRVS